MHAHRNYDLPRLASMMRILSHFPLLSMTLAMPRWPRPSQHHTRRRLHMPPSSLGALNLLALASTDVGFIFDAKAATSPTVPVFEGVALVQNFYVATCEEGCILHHPVEVASTLHLNLIRLAQRTGFPNFGHREVRSCTGVIGVLGITQRHTKEASEEMCQ